MVAAGFLYYGFSLAPAYNSWGFYGPEMTADLGLSKAQLGSCFGLFGLLYSLAAPVSGVCIGRWGLRRTMSLGSLVAASGFYMLSKADSVWDCYLAFSLVGGVGIGLSSQLPSQTIASIWFRKYRARAMAIIIAGGGVIGVVVPYFNRWTLEHASWRDGWEIIALTSVAAGAFAALVIRDRPESLGLEVDGIDSPAHQPAKVEKEAEPPPSRPRLTASQAIRTPQFLLITLAAIGASAPWTAFSAHGPTHLGEMGFADLVIANLWALRSFTSTWGRLMATVADFVRPPVVLAIALVLQGLGMAGLAFADTQFLAYTFMIIFTLGFGIALLSVPLVFAHFFGAEAFAETQGTSRGVVGFARFVSPTLTGYLADRTGSYLVPFLGLAVISVGAAVVAVMCPAPGGEVKE